MDVSTLARLARDLGATEVKERAGKVQCSCLLAQWTHFGGRDSKPSMVLFPAGKYGDPIYTCLGCHSEGSVRDLVLDHMTTGRNLTHWICEIDGEPVPEGAERKNQRLVSMLSRIPDDPKPKRKASAAPVTKLMGDDGRPWYSYQVLAEADAVPEISWGVYNPYAGKVPKYALSRGLTLETCKEWQLGHDPATKRLLFPIRDRKGRLVAISGRLYEEKRCVSCGGPIVQPIDESGKKSRKMCGRCDRLQPPKYLHSEGFKRNLVLYGEHRRQDNIDGNVYLVEGHLDMLLLWQAGYRPVVAMLGSWPGHCQIEKLIAYWGRRVTIVPDGDKAGGEMAGKVKTLIADRVPVEVKKLPEGRDPGSLAPEEMRDFLGDPPSPKPVDIAQETL